MTTLFQVASNSMEVLDRVVTPRLLADRTAVAMMSRLDQSL